MCMTHQGESVIAGTYFSQTPVIYFCWGFSCCPYSWDVCNGKMRADCIWILIDELDGGMLPPLLSKCDY